MVSIIMPVYNSEKYIEESIKSVLCQSYNDFELIIVDDCSSDGSRKIMQGMADKDDRIKVIHLEQNKGVANARNVGMENAAGEYIMFLDSDDIFFPDAVKILVDRMKKTGADMTIGNYRYRYEYKKKYVQGSHLNDMLYEGEDVAKCMHLSCLHGIRIVKTEMIRRFDIKNPLLRMGEDLSFHNICLSRCRSIATVSDNVLTYRMHEGSTSKTYGEKILDFIKAFHIIEDNYNKAGLGKLNNDFLYDELFYVVGNIKKLPRYMTKKERDKIFDALTGFADDKDFADIAEAKTIEILKEYRKAKQRKTLYTSRATTIAYRVLRKVKNTAYAMKRWK